jgi:hypothetical protein
MFNGVRKTFVKLRGRVKMAAAGALYVLGRPRYLIFAAIVALLFAYILTFTTGGTTNLELLLSNLSFSDKLAVLAAVLGKTFTSVPSLVGAFVWLLSLAQGVLISMLIFHFRHAKKVDDSALMNSSLASFFAILGAGCPTCGTSLLMPLLTAVFSSAAYTILNSISVIIMVVAFVLVLFALRRLGFLCYTIKSRAEHGAKGVKNVKTD